MATKPITVVEVLAYAKAERAKNKTWEAIAEEVRRLGFVSQKTGEPLTGAGVYHLVVREDSSFKSGRKYTKRRSRMEIDDQRELEASRDVFLLFRQIREAGGLSIEIKQKLLATLLEG